LLYVGLSEDADIGDTVGVFKATSLYTPSDIVYRLEPPVKVLKKDNSENIVPADMFRLESTSDGAVIYVNSLDSGYNLQDATRYSFHIVAVDQARTNATATAVVEVTLPLITIMSCSNNTHTHTHTHTDTRLTALFPGLPG